MGEAKHLNTQRSAIRNDYEIIKDPFALFSFALLVFTIVAFLFLLTITARRSAIDVWNSMSGNRYHRRTTDLESSQDDATPLTSSTQASSKARQMPADTSEEPYPSSRKVRFSETVVLKTIPAAPNAFDEVFEEWHKMNANDAGARTGKRLSMSERQSADLHLPSR